MKQPFKRTLSLILSVAMLLSITGLSTVFADGGDAADSDSGNGVINAAQLKMVLETTTPATITVTADITMTENITVKADHTLNIAEGKTVSTGGNTLTIPTGKTLALGGTGTLKADNSNNNVAIYVDGGTLTQGTGSKLHAANSGGGTSVNLWKGELVSTGTILVENSGISSTGITVDGSSLTLTDTTLTVKNSGGTTGVWVWDYGSLTLNNSTMILENAAGDGLNFNGITELIMDATSVIDVRAAMDGIGVQFLSSTTRTITDGAKMILAQGAKLNNVLNCFNDRGIGFTAGGEVTVGAAGAQPSYLRLAAGDYVWNGQYFANTRGAGTYNITVIDGILASLSSTAAPGDTVVLDAISTPERVFKEWSITPEVTFIEGTSKYSSIAKFEMPNQDVVATAIYGPYPTGITLSQSSLFLYSNAAPNTATLTATMIPADAVNISVEWTSDNTTVADVDQNGKVTAHANGTAIITATTTYGGFTASCTVTVSTHSGGGSGSSGGGGGGGGGGTVAKPSAPADKPSANVDTSGAVKPTDAAKTATDKIAAAIKAGQKNPQANVTAENAKSVSAKTLQEMAAAAKKAGGTARLLVDTTVKGKIIARLYLDTALAGNLNNDILLGVTIDPKATKATADLFLKHFGSKVSVVRMAHQGAFGMRVQVAVKADPAVDFTKPVYFYAYDKKSNTYTTIANPAYRVDNSGWLYFFTEQGGDILYTNTVMSRKS